MGCDLCCNLLSISGVFILSIWGYLLAIESPTIEMTHDLKQQSATGCFVVAAVYLVIFVFTSYRMQIAKQKARAAHTHIPGQLIAGGAAGAVVLGGGEDRSRRDSLATAMTQPLLANGDNTHVKKM
eukprot:GDKI01024388.1.p1 GENE.GDKI01024388.1~~GDKI01024388.1.p1  ORF type:complete len:126 (+),score=26.77 GDKI01024388.1:106-483(+)